MSIRGRRPAGLLNSAKSRDGIFNAVAQAGVSRRALLGGLAAVVAARALPAEAQEGPVDIMLRQQVVGEWQNKFDGSQVTAGELLSSSPLLSPDTAFNIERAIPLYADIVNRGGWRPVGARQRLRIGSRSDDVVALRQRLTVTGDLQNNVGTQDVFDSYVDIAVRRFQIRHGMKATGVADKATLDMMNVPAEKRLQQLETNLVRVRSMSGNLGDRYVFVNIPAAQLEAVEMGRVVARHTAVVGKVDRQTPILMSRIHEINFNPYWTVPVSIIQKDLIPKMREDPDYFRRLKIRIFDQKGVELMPEQVNWNSDEAINYRIRQDPGEMNAMGSVKINFHNPHNVYMHDTPFKTLFGDNARFHSSGCMRIQNVRDLVTWILRDTTQWPREAIDNVIRTGERIDAKVTNPVPVYTNYVTAWSTANGVVHFRDDIYGRDGVGELAAMQQL
jgi:L,D-transpeptidase YcbB